MVKARVEAFNGKTATAVKQDIFAKAMMITLCAALAFSIEERVIAECNADKQKRKTKHIRKINRTFAYWSPKCILIGMFIKEASNQPLQSSTNRRPPIQKSVDRPGCTI